MAGDPPKVIQKEVTMATSQEVDVAKGVEKSVAAQTPIKSEAGPPADQPPPAPNGGWMRGGDDQPPPRPPVLPNDPQNWVPGGHLQAPIPMGWMNTDGTHPAIQDAARRRNFAATAADVSQSWLSPIGGPETPLVLRESEP